MSFTNFAALQSLTSVGDSDQLLVSLNNGLSGAAGFGRVTTIALEKSLDVYTTVQTTSGAWKQTLSFNSSNAQLSISDGNTISLSALSASGTGVRALTGNWQSTYSTVSSQSANWQSTYTTVSSNSASWNNNLTIFRQVSSIVAPNNLTHVHALSVNSLSANVDFAIIAKGTGATLAQIPNLSASGGNKRGQYATDWQKERGQAAQVASGNNSTIGGGGSNTASGTHSTVAGGQSNSASSSWATVGGGTGNFAGNAYAAVGGGQNNNIGGAYTTIAGGLNNNASGSYAAIAGGINNVASNTGATIGGGGSNTANSTYAIVGGGAGNFAGSSYATIGGGTGNNVSDNYATIGGGSSNFASSPYTAIGGGISNYASGNYATVPGGYGARAHNTGQYAYASNYFTSPGDGQHFQYVLYGSSFGGSAVALTSNYANIAPNDSSVPSLFIAGQNMIAMLTIQIIGFDDSGNYSSGLQKIVVRKLAANSYYEELLVSTSIGSDATGAGAFTFEINTNASPEHVFIITGSSNSGDNTRWVAHVSGTWVYQPPAYA